MDDSGGLSKTIAVSLAGYPIYLARTLIQLGYEPAHPASDGTLPNIFSYISIIREQRGYMALYTGLRFYLPIAMLKKTSYDWMALKTNHKKENQNCDASEIIAVCMRESALRVQSTILTYPLTTLCIGYISSVFFNANEAIEYTFASLYKGIVPKLIIEVTMVWVSIISRRITAGFIEDDLGQAIVSRVPPYLAQSLLYPLNVVTTVMADNGRSGVNPKFDHWQQCYRYLQMNNQLKRGSSFFFRRSYQTLPSSQFSIRRYY